ncbi:MAG: alpha/beta hydrolase [Pseudomonadota bacterium]
MSNYVLVHGGNISTDTWNKLSQRNDYPAGENLGEKIWKNTAAYLKSKGHVVFTPSLKDENKYNLSDHIQQICDLIIENNLKHVYLIGHSYGGMVITGVANKIPEKISSLIYLDAALPEPGQSLFDLLHLGGFDPKKTVDGEPKAYMEKLWYDPKKLETLYKIFIFCTESEFASVINLAKEKINTHPNKWRCYELTTSHIPQCTMPDKLNEILLQIGITSL